MSFLHNLKHSGGGEDSVEVEDGLFLTGLALKVPVLALLSA